MKPFLFGELQIPSFFFMIAVGAVLFTFYCYWVAGRAGLKREYFLDMGMIGILAGFLGGRIFHVLVEAPDYYWEQPLRFFEFHKGGFVSYGAYLGVPLACYGYLRLRRLAIWPHLDIVAIGTPILQFFIRVACLLTGCCYGRPTDVPWAITFTDPASTAYYYFPNTPLHPTQIYSGLHAVALFLFINWFYRKKRTFPGQTAWVMMILYLIPRAIVEAFRADSDRGLWFGGLLSTGQIVAIVGVLLSLVMYFYLKKKHVNPHGT